MPFDIPMQDMIPENLDFEVMFEPTKVKDKKYVINGYTGEYIGVVGDTFNCASHKDFFHGADHHENFLTKISLRTPLNERAIKI